MAVIQSGTDTTLLTIDHSSNAARVTLYDINGVPITSSNDIFSSGTITGLNSSVSIALGGQGGTIIQILGTNGTLTASFEATIDEINWFSINVANLSTNIISNSTTMDGVWVTASSGYSGVRVRISSFVVGAMTISLRACPTSQIINSSSVSTISGDITDRPARLLGIIYGSQGQQLKQTSTNFNTQVELAVGGTLIDPRSIRTLTSSDVITANQNGTWTVQPGNVANTTPWLITINQGGNSAAVTGSNALKIDGSATIQPVSGTVTANQGTSPWVDNISQFGGSNVVTGTGASGAGIPRITIANDSNILATQSGSWSVTTAPAADINPATINITVQDTASTTTTGSNSQSIITGTPTTNSTANFSVASLETVQIQTSGTWTGTLQVEVSIDGGTTWYIRNIHQTGTDRINASFTANFSGGANVGGYTNIRVRAIASMTGTATIKVTESINNNMIYVANAQRVTDNAGNYMPVGDTAARKIFMAVTDGTNTSAVKAGSTAAIATDPALVVAVSPNNGLALDSTVSTFSSKIAATAALADATANPTVTSLGVFSQTYNGSTWDRAKSGLTTAQSSATGFQNMLSMGIYNSSAPTLTNGQTILLQLDVNGNLKSAIAPQTSSVFSFSSVATTGVAIKSSAGIGFVIQFANNTGGTITPLLFNATSTQSNGAVPYWIGSTVGNGAFGSATLGSNIFGLPFSTGLWLQFSSTTSTLTSIASTAVTGGVVYM